MKKKFFPIFSIFSIAVLSGLLLSSFLYVDNYYYTNNYPATANPYSLQDPIAYINTLYNLYSLEMRQEQGMEMFELWVENSEVRPMAHYLQDLAYFEIFIRNRHPLIDFSDVNLSQSIDYIIYQLETFEFVNDVLFLNFLAQYLIYPLGEVIDITIIPPYTGLETYIDFESEYYGGLKTLARLYYIFGFMPQTYIILPYSSNLIWLDGRQQWNAQQPLVEYNATYFLRNPIDYILNIESDCVPGCPCMDSPGAQEMFRLLVENSEVRPMAHYLQDLAYLEVFIRNHHPLDVNLSQSIDYIIYQLETFEFVNDVLFYWFLGQYLLFDLRLVGDIDIVMIPPPPPPIVFEIASYYNLDIGTVGLDTLSRLYEMLGIVPQTYTMLPYSSNLIWLNGRQQLSEQNTTQ